MDWQTLAAYVIVAAAAVLAARALLRAIRGKSTLPACPGCIAGTCKPRQNGAEEQST